MAVAVPGLGGLGGLRLGFRRRKQGGVCRWSCIICSSGCGVGSSSGRCSRWGSGVGDGVVIVGSGCIAIDILRGVVTLSLIDMSWDAEAALAVVLPGLMLLNLRFADDPREDKIYYILAIMSSKKQRLLKHNDMKLLHYHYCVVMKEKCIERVYGFFTVWHHLVFCWLIDSIWLSFNQQFIQLKCISILRTICEHDNVKWKTVHLCMRILLLNCFHLHLVQQKKF